MQPLGSSLPSLSIWVCLKSFSQLTIRYFKTPSCCGPSELSKLSKLLQPSRTFVGPDVDLDCSRVGYTTFARDPLTMWNARGDTAGRGCRRHVPETSLERLPGPWAAESNWYTKSPRAAGACEAVVTPGAASPTYDRSPPSSPSSLSPPGRRPAPQKHAFLPRCQSWPGFL